jgi:putative hemolysin
MDLQERLHLATAPEGSYQTSAGFVLEILARHPNLGDEAHWEGWNFEVAEMEGLTLKRLVARRAAP